SIYVDSER
ncbi:hypothetical protein D044_1876B, partial [Vibrio parahaemolyticus EKP-026]